MWLTLLASLLLLALSVHAKSTSNVFQFRGWVVALADINADLLTDVLVLADDNTIVSYVCKQEAGTPLSRRSFSPWQRP